MNYTKLFVFMTIALVAITSFASAQNLDVLYVKINGEEYLIMSESEVLAVI